MRIVLPMISMKCIDYFKEVIVPIIKVIVITPILPLIAYNYIGQSVITFFIICFISVICVLGGVYYWGCLKSEREFAINKIRQIVFRKNE